MKIGLIDIEEKVFNTAYMQIACYYKSKGHCVEWWSPLTNTQFDHVFCSSLFTFTNKAEVPARAICGGTGFDVSSRLSTEIEDSLLDYSIYPKCETTYIWFSRGCIRDCEFCVVQQKEGFIYPVVTKNLNPAGKYITVMDNNFFASPRWMESIASLRSCGQPVDFQGIDVRTITEQQCKSLTKLKHHKQIKIAWDNTQESHLVISGIIRMGLYIPPWQLMCYVLIGFNSTHEENMLRVETLRKMKVDPFLLCHSTNTIHIRQRLRGGQTTRRSLIVVVGRNIKERFCHEKFKGVTNGQGRQAVKTN